MFVGFLGNVIYCCLLLSVSIRVSKNAIEYVDFSYSNLIELFVIFRLVRKLCSFSSLALCMINMSSMNIS